MLARSQIFTVYVGGELVLEAGEIMRSTSLALSRFDRSLDIRLPPDIKHRVTITRTYCLNIAEDTTRFLVACYGR